jgi:hypothetical protein
VKGFEEEDEKKRGRGKAKAIEKGKNTSRDVSNDIPKKRQKSQIPNQSSQNSTENPFTKAAKNVKETKDHKEQEKEIKDKDTNLPMKPLKERLGQKGKLIILKISRAGNKTRP